MVSGAPEPSVIGRQEIVDALRAAMSREEFVRAAWLGGSDASGRTDEWSDVDLVAVVRDERVEDAFRTVETALVALGPISHRYRLPEPTWHGHAQEFYALRDADPCHMVDFVAMKVSAGGRLLEPERHGTPKVLLDRDGLVKPAPLDRAPLHAALRRRLEDLRSLFPLFQCLSIKAVRRGDVADAASRYPQMTLKPLVEVLRMRHCPDRWDFGFRYLDRDLPADVREAVEALMLPPTLDDVERYRARAEALFRDQLHALDAGEWSLPE